MRGVLIEWRNDRDDVWVPSEHARQSFDDRIGALDIRCIRLPAWVAKFLSRVVEPAVISHQHTLSLRLVKLVKLTHSGYPELREDRRSL